MRKSNCAGIYTPRNVGSKTVLNAGPNLSAFTDLICGTYVLEKCYEVGRAIQLRGSGL